MVLTLVAIGTESPVALAVFLMDGVIAIAIIAAAGLSGGWLAAPLLKREAAPDPQPPATAGSLEHRPLDRAERLILGAGLGIGILPLVVLAFGAAGLLTRSVAVALTGMLGLIGAVRVVKELHLRFVLSSVDLVRDPQPDRPKVKLPRVSPLWLIVVPFLALLILGTTLPPGVLWQEEGFGYDILEYHLAVPKTFFEQGQITFLPNNVYSNFPLASEMLSLLMMTLRGDAIEGAFSATSVNIGLAVLFVAAAWLAAENHARGTGLPAGLLAGTLPWIPYLAGIAYVEAGMLALGMCALAALLPAVRGCPELVRRSALAGLLAGLACGFKYTAVPLIAMPLVLLVLGARAPWGRRAMGAVMLGLTAFVAFSPWMVRNVVNTGNPVFPLGYRVLGAEPGVWDDQLQDRWQRAHGWEEWDDGDVPLWWRAIERTIGDFRMGGISLAAGERAHGEDRFRYHVIPGALLILAFVGLVHARDRSTWLLLLILIVQVGVWVLATHLFARFAVVMALPLVVLASSALAPRPQQVADTGRTGRRVVFALLLMGAAINLYQFGTLYYHHTRMTVEPGQIARIEAYGRTDAFVQGQWPGTEHLKAINELGPRARVMLVGDARSYYCRVPCEYATVFNHHPLAEAIERLPDLKSVLGWLRERGTTHVLVNWSEIVRLSRTYGFEPALDPDRDPTLYARLAAAGLEERQVFSAAPQLPPYATLFEVPNE